MTRIRKGTKIGAVVILIDFDPIAVKVPGPDRCRYFVTSILLYTKVYDRKRLNKGTRQGQ